MSFHIYLTPIKKPINLSGWVSSFLFTKKLEKEQPPLYLIYPIREYYLKQSLNIQVLLENCNHEEVMATGSVGLCQQFSTKRGEKQLTADLYLYSKLMGVIYIGAKVKFQEFGE